MGRFWLQLWTATKLTLAGVLLLYILIFVGKNYDQPTKYWVWFNASSDTTTLKLSFAAFIAGVVGTLLVRTTFSTMRQIRAMKERTRHDKMQRDLDDMKARTAVLQSRPIDETSPET